MGYEVDILPSAKIEIAEALDYYSIISDILPQKFMDELYSLYELLRINPHYQKRHEYIRGLPLRRFPYILFFTVDETIKTVKVLSCFHTSQNPKKYPI